jgi:hypothetical protein
VQLPCPQGEHEKAAKEVEVSMKYKIEEEVAL